MNDYNFSKDSHGCWLLGLRWARLKAGLTTFATIEEMYRLEAWGHIP